MLLILEVSKKMMLVPPLETLSLLLLSKVVYRFSPCLSIISNVDPVLDSSCILVSCKHKMEISLSIQYCIALLLSDMLLWSIPCGSYSLIMVGGAEIPAMLYEANPKGVLLISHSILFGLETSSIDGDIVMVAIVCVGRGGGSRQSGGRDVAAGAGSAATETRGANGGLGK